MRFSHLCLSLLLLSVAMGCQQEQKADKQEISRPVKLVEVRDLAGPRVRQFPAVVEATEDAALTFRVSGQLTELLVRPGQEVEKDQLLAQLDPSDFEVRLQQAQASYELSKSQFERAQQLRGQNLISQSQFDEAQAQMRVSEANLVAANNNLKYTKLTAPFSGSVARLYVEQFENVVAKQTILDLQVRSAIDVVIQVPEDFIARAKKGIDYQPEVRFDSYPQYTYKVDIKEWDTKSDPTTGSYRVAFTMPTPQEFNVLSGMTATVSMDITQVTSIEFGKLLVPNEAVFNDPKQPGKSFVWTLSEESRAVKTEVELGELTSDGFVVNSGVSLATKIIAAGVYQVQPGMLVHEWKRERGL